MALRTLAKKITEQQMHGCRRFFVDRYEERRCSLPLLPCYTADTEGSIEGKILVA